MLTKISLDAWQVARLTDLLNRNNDGCGDDTQLLNTLKTALYEIDEDQEYTHLYDDLVEDEDFDDSDFDSEDSEDSEQN